MQNRLNDADDRITKRLRDHFNSQGVHKYTDQARQMGISSSHWHAIRKGKGAHKRGYGRNLRAKICHNLGVTEEWLLGRTQHREGKKLCIEIPEEMDHKYPSLSLLWDCLRKGKISVAISALDELRKELVENH